MLLPTAIIILIFCAITCELRPADPRISIDKLAGSPSAVVQRVSRSVSSGSLTTSTGIRLARFGSSKVGRVLTLNYVSTPGSFAYRRSYSVPQPLLCIGGNNHCNFVPTSVQCYHKSEGSELHWQCETEQMNSTLCFGMVEISCDSEIPSEFVWTSGDHTPCRMLYTINRLESSDPYEKRLQCSATHYDADDVHAGRRTPGIISLTLFMLAIGLIAFAIVMLWFSKEDFSPTPKLPFEDKSPAGWSESSGDSSVYPQLPKEINSDKQADDQIDFKAVTPTAPRSHSR